MHAAPMHKRAARHRASGCFCATHPRVQSGRQECQGQAPGSARSTATAALRMSSVLAPGASSARTPAATTLFSRSVGWAHRDISSPILQHICSNKQLVQFYNTRICTSGCKQAQPGRCALRQHCQASSQQRAQHRPAFPSALSRCLPQSLCASYIR